MTIPFTSATISISDDAEKLTAATANRKPGTVTLYSIMPADAGTAAVADSTVVDLGITANSSLPQGWSIKYEHSPDDGFVLHSDVLYHMFGCLVLLFASQWGLTCFKLHREVQETNPALVYGLCGLFLLISVVCLRIVWVKLNPKLLAVQDGMISWKKHQRGHEVVPLLDCDIFCHALSFRSIHDTAPLSRMKGIYTGEEVVETAKHGGVRFHTVVLTTIQEEDIVVFQGRDASTVHYVMHLLEPYVSLPSRTTAASVV